jgi:hypothetical protein
MKRNKRINDTDLPVITINALWQDNIVTLEDLAGKTRMELSRIKNLGKKGISHIEQVMFEHGYRLKCRQAAYNIKYRFDEDKLAVIVPRLQHQLKGMLSMQKAVYESLQALEEVMKLERVGND